MPKHCVNISKSDETLTSNVRLYLVSILEEILNESKDDRKIFIGISGGSMLGVLAPIFKELITPEMISRVYLLPMDERLEKLESSASNVGCYMEELPDYFDGSFIKLDEIVDARLAAEKMENELRRIVLEVVDNFPVLDVCFLGIGPDGHTCSLFPGHKLLEEKRAWICPIVDSPKPPPKRVTVTLPVINHARNVAFIVKGEDKAQVLKKIIDENDVNYPPSLINPTNAKSIHWFINEAASAQLRYSN